MDHGKFWCQWQGMITADATWETIPECLPSIEASRQALSPGKENVKDAFTGQVYNIRRTTKKYAKINGIIGSKKLKAILK